MVPPRVLYPAAFDPLVVGVVTRYKEQKTEPQYVYHSINIKRMFAKTLVRWLLVVSNDRAEKRTALLTIPVS